MMMNLSPPVRTIAFVAAAGLLAGGCGSLKEKRPKANAATDTATNPSTIGDDRAPLADAGAVVTDFYARWVKAEDPTSMAASDPALTAAFAKRLRQGPDFDQVICAQELPTDPVTTAPPVKTGTGATVQVTEHFPGEVVNPVVSLVDVASVWKIDDITCPIKM